MDNELFTKKQALLQLIQDSTTLAKLKSRVSDVNIFNVLKVSRTEIRHSNMLAWLLDPNENHGLSDKFLRNFIIELSKKDYDKADFFINLLLSDLSNVVVYRERHHIDLLLIFRQIKSCVAIENKVDSHEHNSNGTDESQLKVYSKKIKKEFSDYKCYKVYMSPEGECPSVDDWNTFSYSDLLAALTTMYESNKGNVSRNVDLLIGNYIEIIKHEILMDEELIQMCNEIYKTHKVALDLIFENKQDDLYLVSQNCRNWVNRHASLELLNGTSPKYIKFKYNELTDLFGENYYCEFQLLPDNGNISIQINLVFRLDGATDDKINKMKKFNSKIAKQSGLQRGLSGIGNTSIELGIDDQDKKFGEVLNNFIKEINKVNK